MSEERMTALDQSLRSLRKRVDQLDHGRHETAATLRHAVLACAVAGAVVALTATTWRTVDDGDHVDAVTLWGLVPDGWQGAVALGLVLAVAAGTFGVSLGDPSRGAHLVLVALALLAAVAVLVVGAVDSGGGWYDPEDYGTAPGRWLTLLAVLLLAAVHGGRAGELR